MTILFFQSHSSKRGVSLMLSYVLLISMAIFLAITVYASLKLIANVKPVASCESGTSLVIDDYTCVPGVLSTNPIIAPVFSLTFKNNGLFNVTGVIVAISDDDTKTPVTPIDARNIPNRRPGTTGAYVFPTPVEPGQTYAAYFDATIFSTTSNTIKQARIQPFILNEKQNLVVCGDAVFIEKLANCMIG